MFGKIFIFFNEHPIKMMLKSPLLLRGHEKILRNLLKWVYKSTPNFPVLLEGYKLFFQKRW